MTSLGLGLVLLVALTVSGDAQQINTAQALDSLQQFLQQRTAGQNLQQSGTVSTVTQPNGLQGSTTIPAVGNASTTANGQSTTATSAISSRLEQIMSQRAGVKLQQFGYDQLGQGHDISLPPLAGAVQDDYMLGPGDIVAVTLRGQENSQYAVPIDRQGQLTLPRMRPIGAAGRTFGSVRQEVEAAVHRSYVATDAFVSLGEVRQISVLVAGEINFPGQRMLSGLSTVVDALMVSGGVKKTGSLRNVRIQRGDREFTVDLYSVLTDRAARANLRLADGDRILVPLLGPTVAITGLVRRPGIFELPARQTGLTARNLLDLAGGQEVRGAFRFSVLRILPDGRFSMVPLSNDSGIINDSEILFVQFGANQYSGQATLSGGTGLAGQYPVTQGSKLSDWLRQPGALGTNPYTLFGLIVRRDPQTLMRTLVAFTPLAVLSGSEDEVLLADDNVRVFQVSEIQLLSLTIKAYKQRRQAEQENIRNPLAGNPADNNGNSNANGSNGTGSTTTTNANGTTTTTNPQGTVDALTSQNVQNSTTAAENDLSSILTQPGLAPSKEPAPNFQDEALSAGQYASNRQITSFSDLAHQLDIDPLVLVNFLIDRQTTIEGAVRGPGDYFIGPNVPLKDLVQAAGGTLNWADQSGVELISTSVDTQSGKALTRRISLPLRQGTLANYVVRPRDALRFNQIYNDVDMGSVTLQGEVRFPGTFSIVRGEHLSDLLARAGGLTDTAYPYGTVFLRRSAAAAEHDGYVRMAQEIESQLLVNTSRLGSVPVPASQIQQLATQFRTQKALGRIAIIADPSILASKPEIDPLLEAGDVVYIPQRPSTVAVLGLVMQQGSYRYEVGKSVKDYINDAGGYAQFSDESNTFVVLPDGSARKVDVSWLNFDATALPPGSAIVVPRDLQPFDLRQAFLDSTQIFSQIAVTVASLAVLSKQ